MTTQIALTAAGTPRLSRRHLDVAGAVQVVSYAVLAEASYEGLPLLLDAATAITAQA